MASRVDRNAGGRVSSARRRVRLGMGLGMLAVVASLSIGGGPGLSDLARVGPFAAQACDTAALLAGNRSAVASIEDDAETNFHQQLNGLRQDNGLRTLVWNEPISAPSVEWSRTMSGQIPPGGSSADPGWLHHARDTGAGDGVEPSQDYVNINSKLVPNWTRLAENVGVGGMRSSCTLTDLRTNTDRVVDALHNAFVNSPGHYANMVGDHNQVGIGVYIDPDELWVTVRFANGDLPTTTEVSADARAFIDAAYRTFLGRGATSGEQSTWGGRVQGGDRLALTTALAVSDQWAGTMVDDLYRTVLGRGADAGGRSYWVGQIARGLQFESVAVEFYGSPEYFSRSGGTEVGYVRSLYDDLLGRTADQTGVNYWTGEIRAGTTRSDVAIGFYGSLESRTDRTAALWSRIIGGSVSSNVINAWADRLAQVGMVRLAAELASTSAYWAKVT